MAYHLIHKFGPHDKPQSRRETFATEQEALIRACTHIAAGLKGEFFVEDDNGRVIANEVQVRVRCKATRVP